LIGINKYHISPKAKEQDREIGKFIALMMAAICTSETIYLETGLCYIPEGCHLKTLDSSFE
jgi:hypothetical protein